MYRSIYEINRIKCWRSVSTWDISIEKIIYWKYVDDLCLNGTLKAHNKHTQFGSFTTPDGRDIWRIQNFLTNTTTIMRTDGNASNYCAWVNDSNKKNSETYVYIR